MRAHADETALTGRRSLDEKAAKWMLVAALEVLAGHYKMADTRRA